MATSAWRSTDLNDAQSPEDVARTLRNAAARYRESAEELNAKAHTGAAMTWRQMAANLERTADAMAQLVT